MRLLWALIGVGSAPAAHPIHTTITQIVYAKATGMVEVSIRVFADDLQAGYARSRGGVGPAPSDSALAGYLASGFTLGDPSGAPARFAFCGVRRAQDLIWLCLKTTAPRGVAGAVVGARMLFEVFDDQVNVVQVVDGSRRQTVLFTKGDGVKRLR